jgi:hypothetical protein
MHPDARRHLEAHIAGERNRDLDALMAPLSEQVRYVIPGWILEGRAAVQAMYERVLSLLTPALSEEYLRALDDPRVARWGDDHIVIEYTDEYPLHCGMVVVVHFDVNGRVRSENTYFATPALLSRHSTESYDGTAGATRI